MKATGNAGARSGSTPSTARLMWLRTGSVTAFVSAAAALLGAAAGGITEPTGIAAAVAIITSVVAYGLGPLLLTFAMRQVALSTWWGVAAALFAASLWIALLLAAPAMSGSPALVAAVVISAPSASALWLVAASVEVARAGMPRWSLVFVSAFVTVLVIASAFIELRGFDVRKVLVPLGWAVWMIDVGRALRARLAPSVDAPAVVAPTRCENCGAPRRTDGLAFCSGCGLPYGSQRK